MQEADERQKRFMALNAGWKKKEASLAARAEAAEQAAAAAAAAASDAASRADGALQVAHLMCHYCCICLIGDGMLRASAILVVPASSRVDVD